ncbi:type III-A CRISPR-associated CARF protein Csm6 [Pseudoflavonifractor phocaeensis]|uniref:type III-A CRISPR-associated CARF protein Csm6 n=1 Tax=Pseudoflavonifractor phocaeensis TaxID=1870988 RepID=UPI00195B604C|nr:hypothetical protein [Pseudoflavonifractor phocaeensis]MBM6926827.1 hypothetical protein [Pseudoflavonifractor phocaeensis]
MADLLFSPVGGTDPISFERDGGLLHICRRYHPDRVMLYLSKEMVEHQARDDRYRAALRLLAEEDGFPMEILSEERPGLENPHIFDVFYQDFERLLRNLHRSYPRHRILVNLSSGTPAMKSALAVLINLLDFPVMGIQVDSPNRRHNGRREDPQEFDLALYWECDLDRMPEHYVDRCRVLHSENLRAKLQGQALEAHLEAGDYRAALEVGRQMGDLLPLQARQLLEAACLRERQEWRRIQPLELREKMIPKAKGDEERDIFEYLIGLRSRQQRGALVDFLRGLTPALYRLSLYAVEHQLKLPIRRYCDGRERLIRDRLNTDETGRRVLRLLDNTYPKGYKDTFLASEQCCKILEVWSDDQALKQPLLMLRDVEKNARNLAAHTIVPVTEEFVRRSCGCSSSQILTLIQSAAGQVLECPNLIWDSYERMNEHIKKAMTALPVDADTAI